MAWRIHDNVLRGELDNREQGVVRGRIWMDGWAEPMTLELRGNACPDLAGCVLEFVNSKATFPLPGDRGIATVQRGSIGDLTASRKVRVLDIPVREAYLRKKRGQPVPEHLANSLYLEWFSESNGRMVIESADYRLKISPPLWRLSQENERERHKQAADSFSGFMNKLNEALDSKTHRPPEDKQWDEFDYEKLMKESDARTDKYIELLDKYMDHPDRERIIAREMGWTWLDEALDERAKESKTPPTDSPRAGSLTSGEPNTTRGDLEDTGDSLLDFPMPENIPALEPDPSTEGIDWVRDEDGEVSHPVSLMAFNGSIALWRRCKALNLRKSADTDLGRLVDEYQTTAAKLAGALDSLAYGRELREGPFVVAYLKRALAHLHAAQNALEKVAPKNLLPSPDVESLRQEMFKLRERILQLMDEFRKQR